MHLKFIMCVTRLGTLVCARIAGLWEADVSSFIDSYTFFSFA